MKMAAKEWRLREKVSGGMDEELAWRTVDRSNEMAMSQACACQDRWHHRRKRMFVCLIIELAICICLEAAAEIRFHWSIWKE